MLHMPATITALLWGTWTLGNWKSGHGAAEDACAVQCSALLRLAQRELACATTLSRHESFSLMQSIFSVLYDHGVRLLLKICKTTWQGYSVRASRQTTENICNLGKQNHESVMCQYVQYDVMNDTNDWVVNNNEVFGLTNVLILGSPCLDSEPKCSVLRNRIKLTGHHFIYTVAYTNGVFGLGVFHWKVLGPTSSHLN